MLLVCRSTEIVRPLIKKFLTVQILIRIFSILIIVREVRHVLTLVARVVFSCLSAWGVQIVIFTTH